MGDGPHWQTGALTVGSQGLGTLEIAFTTQGGEVTTSGDAYIARYTGSAGSYAAVGDYGEWNVNGTLWVGGGNNVDGPGEAATLYVATGGRVAATGHIKAWGPGLVHLAGGTVEADLLNIAGGLLLGSGTVDGHAANNGYVIIGDPSGDPIGEIEILGDYTQISGALLIDIGGSSLSQFDRLVVDGAVSLASLLEVTVVNDYEPLPAETFQIVDALGGLTGQFDGLGYGTTFSAGGFEFTITYDAGVQLEFVGYTLPADFDLDGDVDADDLARWKTGLGTGTLHSQGDADLDGDVDLADLMAWQNQFGNSLPLLEAETAVPEPSGLLLLVLGTIPICFRRLLA